MDTMDIKHKTCFGPEMIKIYGLDGAIDKSKELYEKCKNILSSIENNGFLMDFTDYMYNRKK